MKCRELIEILEELAPVSLIMQCIQILTRRPDVWRTWPASGWGLRIPGC